MSIESPIIITVGLISAIPLFVFLVSENITGIYKKRILQGKISSKSELPSLVKLHMRLVQDIKLNLLAGFGSLAILFGIPTITVSILWPLELLSFLQSLPFWVILCSILMLLTVGCNSPDPTGGLGSAHEVLEKEQAGE
ncbi:MAG: hypothetical protein GF309_06995 [Candidatus Lokiarchaeota archaeon]|nr:hypothetical protein [Candidatus Lokiarchaeota archaeon]